MPQGLFMKLSHILRLIPVNVNYPFATIEKGIVKGTRDTIGEST